MMRIAAIAVFLASAAISAQAATAQQKDFMLFGMNKARAEKGVAAIEWDDTVAAFAQSYSDQCALGVHNPNRGDYGENIAYYSGQGNGLWFPNQFWIDSEYASTGCPATTYNHYTQILWAASTKVGCGISQCGQSTNIVCNFSPAGNYYGQKPFPQSQCNSVVPCTPSSTCTIKGGSWTDSKCGYIDCGGGSPSTPTPSTPAPSTPSPTRTPAPATPTPSTPAPSGGGATAQQKDLLLFGMNKARAEKGVDAIQWDDEVAAFAQAYSDQCALGVHNPNRGDYGENIAYYSGSGNGMWFPNQFWIDSEYASTGCPATTYNHYTQILWAASTKIGCGVTLCGQSTNVVCNFSPMGNYYGEQPFPEDQCNSVVPCTPSSTCTIKGGSWTDQKCGYIDCSGAPATPAPATDAPATDAPVTTPPDYMIQGGGNLQNGWSDWGLKLNNAETYLDGDVSVHSTLGPRNTYSTGGNYFIFIPPASGATVGSYITLQFDAVVDADHPIYIFWNGYKSVIVSLTSQWNTHTISLSNFNLPDGNLPYLVFWNQGSGSVELYVRNVQFTTSPSLSAGEPAGIDFNATIPQIYDQKSSTKTTSDASTVLLSFLAVTALILSMF